MNQRSEPSAGREGSERPTAGREPSGRSARSEPGEQRAKRRIFVGDVQGCREELERLLELLHFDEARDELQPVGDLVNRGPDSAGTLRLCRTLAAGGVLGNHDVHLLRTSAGLRPMRKQDTFQDVLRADDRDEMLAWLAQRPFVRSWDDVLMVHAGINPTWKDPVAVLAKLDPLSDGADSAFAIAARYCDERGRRPEDDWPPPPPPFRPWYEFWPRDPGDRRIVVFGHWARAGLVVRPQVRGLDTGCVWGGQLTAWIAEEDRIIQVDAARQYADHE